MEDEVREWAEGDTELETQTRRNPSICEMWRGNLSQLLSHFPWWTQEPVCLAEKR